MQRSEWQRNRFNHEIDFVLTRSLRGWLRRRMKQLEGMLQAMVSAGPLAR
jgi:hypothetical protein